MFSRSVIYDGTVTLFEYICTVLHRHSKVDYITKYHTMISKILGVKYVYSFGSGRGSLYSILKAMNIGDGDDVLVQGYTCVAVPKAIMYTGAKPVYADISIEDYSVTLETVRNSLTPSTKAVIVQHTYGIPCHAICDICDYCKSRGIYVIEDCAHTFDLEYNGKKLGSFGDAAFISTDHSKYISTCVGGVAVTDNEEIGSKLAAIYDQTEQLTNTEIWKILKQLKYGIIYSNKFVNPIVNMNKYTRLILGKPRNTLYWDIGTYWLDDYDCFGWPEYTFPGKLSNVQAYLGISQIKKLERIINHRAIITQIYRTRINCSLSNYSDCVAPLMHPLLVDEPERTSLMLRRVTEVGRWFQNEILCISREKYGYVFFDSSLCPNARSVAERIINLPNHLKITKGEAKRICRILNTFVTEKNARD